MRDEDINTTMAQIENHYADYEPFERVAEVIVQCDNRRVDYIYELNHEGETVELEVSAKYYDDDELVNESNTTQTYTVVDGKVQHAGGEFDLMRFVEDNATADPEITLTDEYESMV